jgi:hypothetical protein
MSGEGPVGGVAFLSGAPIVIEQWAEKLQVRVNTTGGGAVAGGGWRS